MTNSDLRKYGYVSRLWALRCGGGPSQQAVNTQTQLTQQQMDIAKQQNILSAEDRAQMKELTQPLVDKEMALATGDRNAALAASMPTISKITAGYDAAKQSIFTSLPPGPARDAALAKIQTDRAMGSAGAQAEMVSKAPDVLASVGSGFGGLSLQDVGAALSGYGGASTSNQATAQMQNQQSQAKWAPITGLAQAAGGMFSFTKAI